MVSDQLRAKTHLMTGFKPTQCSSIAQVEVWA